MFFNRNYIPAVPIREEQRLSEEEELARALKREARIFFPDKKLPDFDGPGLPPIPKERRGPDMPPEKKSGTSENDRATVLTDHDAVCRSNASPSADCALLR